VLLLLSMWNKIIIIAIVLVVAGIVYAYTTRTPEISPIIPGRNDDSVFCTADVKECPDGSYVSRSGPNCEFAECPTGVSVEANL